MEHHAADPTTTAARYDGSPDGVPLDRIGVIGSPSTTTDLTVNITNEAAQHDLLGKMVVLSRRVTGEVEHGFGTVQEIETFNQWHENASIRGLIGAIGAVGDLSGEADTRTAQVRVGSVYRQSDDGACRPHGAALSMSPATGTDVRLLDNDTVNEVVVTGADVAYPGGLYQSDDVRVPFATDHFDTPHGAYHCGVFGQSGSGKTGFATLYLAGQMRHTNMGLLVVDPQGEFSKPVGDTPLALQHLAAAQGRDVQVLSVANELRLPKHKTLFTKLLLKIGYFDKIHRIGNSSPDAVEALKYRFARFLDGYQREHGRPWTDAPPDDLAVHIAEFLRENANNVYKKGAASERTEQVAREVLDAPYDAQHMLAPVLSLFAPTAMDGTRRRSVVGLLQSLVDAKATARPYIVINMATSGFADQDVPAGVRDKLDSREAKAAILKVLFNQLEWIAEKAYTSASGTEGRSLNTLIAFDEAHRYAPANTSGIDDDVKDLCDLLARSSRESRKYGIGWFYITQEPRQLNVSIWNQLTGFRAFGYGLGGQNDQFMAEAAGSRDATKLYRSFANPIATQQYPFMITGAASPLSVSGAPLFMTTTNLRTQEGRQSWLNDNRSWLPADFDLSAATASAPQSPPAGAEDFWEF